MINAADSRVYFGAHDAMRRSEWANTPRRRESAYARTDLDRCQETYGDPIRDRAPRNIAVRSV